MTLKPFPDRLQRLLEEGPIDDDELREAEKHTPRRVARFLAALRAEREAEERHAAETQPNVKPAVYTAPPNLGIEASPISAPLPDAQPDTSEPNSVEPNDFPLHSSDSNDEQNPDRRRK